MKRAGFTILELIFVIIVIGILAAYMVPRMNRDYRQEAADTILSAIRYTQHLALNDDKTDPTQLNWQRAFWQIRFSLADSKWFFLIASDSDHNANIDRDESAIDPSNGKRYYNETSSYTVEENESPSIFLTKRFGIDTIKFDNCKPLTGSAGNSNVQHIAFDHLGRPHQGVFGATHDFRTMMHGDCNLTFEFDSGEDDLIIHIEPHTGYAWIVGQDDS